MPASCRCLANLDYLYMCSDNCNVAQIFSEQLRTEGFRDKKSALESLISVVKSRIKFLFYFNPWNIDQSCTHQIQEFSSKSPASFAEFMEDDEFHISSSPSLARSSSLRLIRRNSKALSIANQRDAGATCFFALGKLTTIRAQT